MFRWIPALLVGAGIFSFAFSQPANSYWAYIVCLAGVYLLVVLGFNVLYGMSGQISLGQAGFFGLSAYGYAVLTTAYSWYPWLAVIASVAATTTIAFLIGLVAVRLVHHLLAFLTIGFAETVRILMLNGGPVTGGFTGIGAIPPLTIGSWVFDTYVKLLLLTWFTVGIVALLVRSLRESPWGRSFVAVRDNETAAQAFGVSIRKVRARAFTLSALFAAVGGILFLQLLAYISPDSITVGLSTQFLIMLLIGGVATGWGPLVGTGLIVGLTQLLQPFGAYQGLVLGIVLVATVMLFSNGIVGSLLALWLRIRGGSEERSGRGATLVKSSTVGNSKEGDDNAQ
jgi:branched-chain amino acid transport system permease protein